DRLRDGFARAGRPAVPPGLLHILPTSLDPPRPELASSSSDSWSAADRCSGGAAEQCTVTSRPPSLLVAHSGFPPQPPSALPCLRSAASQVLRRCTTPRHRSSGPYSSSPSPRGPCPADHGQRRASRFSRVLGMQGAFDSAGPRC